MATFSQCSKDFFSETLCKSWARQCANRGLLQVKRGSACDFKKRNVIEMTICVHTINGPIRIKILHAFEMITTD